MNGFVQFIEINSVFMCSPLYVNVILMEMTNLGGYFH